MYAGKIPPAMLKKIVFSSLGPASPLVKVGPGVGEDAAVLQIDDMYHVVASDPVTGAKENCGHIAVHVNANDVAVTGADPQFFMPTILLKSSVGEEGLRKIVDQIGKACNEVGATVVGGHTEFVSSIDMTIIAGTMFGYTSRYISTSGARPGDAIVLTKGAALEGTSILATEREQELKGMLSAHELSIAKGFSSLISVVPEARLIRSYVTSMHDPTEGGVAGALNEMAEAAGCGFDVDPSVIPVPLVTQKVCTHFGCDPLTLISSGALIATVPPAHVNHVHDVLAGAHIEHAFIGTITEEGRTLDMPEHDSLWDILD